MRSVTQGDVIRADAKEIPRIFQILYAGEGESRKPDDNATPPVLAAKLQVLEGVVRSLAYSLFMFSTQEELGMLLPEHKIIITSRLLRVMRSMTFNFRRRHNPTLRSKKSHLK